MQVAAELSRGEFRILERQFRGHLFTAAAAELIEGKRCASEGGTRQGKRLESSLGVVDGDAGFGAEQAPEVLADTKSEWLDELSLDLAFLLRK